MTIRRCFFVPSRVPCLVSPLLFFYFVLIWCHVIPMLPIKIDAHSGKTKLLFNQTLQRIKRNGSSAAQRMQTKLPFPSHFQQDGNGGFAWRDIGRGKAEENWWQSADR